MQRSKWFAVALATMLPLLVGASCSTNAVAQAATTTFLNAIATNAVNTFFRLAFPA
jgi:hypothetical protein